jgi:SMC interacting uncharacterized protein involved in chromosome segregation
VKPAPKKAAIKIITKKKGPIASYPESQEQLKHWQAIKMQQEAELSRLKMEKIMGELIPTDLVKNLIMLHSRSIIMAFKNMIEQMIDRIAGKYKLSAGEIAALRKDSIDKLNTAVQSAINNSKTSLNNIVDEYSNARGAGERA